MFPLTELDFAIHKTSQPFHFFDLTFDRLQHPGQNLSENS